MRLHRAGGDFIAVELIAVIGGKAQAVARQVGQGFVNGVGMEEQRVAESEVGSVPFGF